MDREYIMYLIFENAKDIETVKFSDIRDAYNEIKEFGLKPEEALPDIITTNIMFIYEDGDRIYVDMKPVSALHVNITNTIRKFEEEGFDLLAFLHTHPPQPIMPSIDDVDASFEIQAHFPRCISAIKNYYGLFAYQVDENTYTYAWKSIKDRYIKSLRSIPVDFRFLVPQRDEKWKEEYLLLYDKINSISLDTIGLDTLLRTHMLKFASYTMQS